MSHGWANRLCGSQLWGIPCGADGTLDFKACQDVVPSGAGLCLALPAQNAHLQELRWSADLQSWTWILAISETSTLSIKKSSWVNVHFPLTEISWLILGLTKPTVLSYRWLPSCESPGLLCFWEQSNSPHISSRSMHELLEATTRGNSFM